LFVASVIQHVETCAFAFVLFLILGFTRRRRR